jgi:hypothetical protein
MSNLPIYDTPEYKLASREKQHWAFTHKGQYLSAVDKAKEMGVKLDNLSAMVKVTFMDKATGKQVEKTEQQEIPIDTSFYSVHPSAKLKTVHMGTEKPGKSVTHFMLKGAKPYSKGAVYFTYDDFMASPDVKKIISEIDEATKKYMKRHNEMVKAELVKSHSPAAKKAAKELPELANQEDAAQKVYDWFVKNGFNMGHVKPEHLKHLVNDIKKDGHISSQFHVSARSDGYGHQTGTSGIIDFANKVVGLQGWSSDD